MTIGTSPIKTISSININYATNDRLEDVAINTTPGISDVNKVLRIGYIVTHTHHDCVEIEK